MFLSRGCWLLKESFGGGVGGLGSDGSTDARYNMDSLALAREMTLAILIVLWPVWEDTRALSTVSCVGVAHISKNCLQ